MRRTRRLGDGAGTAAAGERFAVAYDARGRIPLDTVAQSNVESDTDGTRTFEQQTQPTGTIYRGYMTEDVDNAEVVRGAGLVRRNLAFDGSVAVARVDHRA